MHSLVSRAHYRFLLLGAQTSAPALAAAAMVSLGWIAGATVAEAPLTPALCQAAKQRAEDPGRRQRALRETSALFQSLGL